MAKAKREKKAILKIKNARLNLPHLLTPKEWDDGKTEFSTFILIDKKDKETIGMLKAACAKAEKETFPKGRPSGFLYPLKDGAKYAADKDLDAKKYSGYVIFKAKSKVEWPPTVVGPDRQELTGADNRKIYSGCKANLGITCSGYGGDQGKKQPSKGVGFYLSMVQILPGGEALAGKPDPEDFFDEEADFDSDAADDDSDLDLDENADDDLSF